MKKVVLSAGHSLSDPGAVNSGFDPDLKESFLTIEIVKLCVPLLKAHKIKVETIPDNLSLQQTIDLINAKFKDYDIAVELHINAGGGNGVEGWYYQNDDTSKKLSNDILNGMVSETGMKSRGSKDETTNRFGKLGFVHDTIPLACLIECGFIDGVEDIKILSVEEGRYKIAKGVARGICQNLGVTWDDSSLPGDSDDMCGEILKQTKEELGKQTKEKERYKSERNKVKSDFEKFKNDDYVKAVELCKKLEEKWNTETIEHAKTKTLLTEAEDKIKDIKPKLDKANMKIKDLMAQKFTFAESMGFVIKSLTGGGKK